MHETPEGWAIWHGRSHGPKQKLDAEQSDDDLTEVQNPESPRDMGSAIFIQIDQKKNPLFVPVSGVVKAVHILPFHANVWLEDGSILEMPVQLARRFYTGDSIQVLGSPIWIEGAPQGKLWVNCKTA